MTQQEITLLNLGSSLDDLANLDPRGYGVCKLLYKAAREYTGMPLCVNAARKIIETVKKDDVVFIMTGFILAPFNKAETDGVIGSVLLACALVRALGAKPVVVCPDECVGAVEKLLAYLLEDSSDSVEIFVFTKDESEAAGCADKLISQACPKAVISIECPGKDKNGVYRNAKGFDVTELEAKQDVLFEKLCEKGILNIAIGDLGNEIGMSTISGCLESKIPVSPVRTKTDNIITATVSDWGSYSLIAMLAYLLENPDIMHDANVQQEAMNIACRNGLIDMSGEHIPAIDGFGVEITASIVALMKESVKSALNLKESCKYWFDKMTEMGSFEK
ncbi:MAG: DUF4392 domain-containing protein [Clostridia bacterium]|nr:DUF4392 domain-containing protein [Clostridia bacterium]